MKFPKLRHAGLCNILIFLPALFLFFAIGFNIPLANWGTPKWVLALNFLLGCAVSLGYLILGAFPLLYADQVFFLLREWKRSSLEYRTGRARSEWASMRSTAASATGGCADVYEAGGEKAPPARKGPCCLRNERQGAEPAGAGSPRRSRKAAAPDRKLARRRGLSF